MEGVNDNNEESEILVRENLFVFSGENEKMPFLIGGKCKKCGEVDFPKRAFCSLCDSDQLTEEILMGEKGSLHTYTVVRVGFPNYDVPYILGLVDLPESKSLRILAQLSDCEEKELKIGMSLRLQIGKIKVDPSTGKDVIGYKYCPVKD